MGDNAFHRIGAYWVFVEQNKSKLVRPDSTIDFGKARILFLQKIRPAYIVGPANNWFEKYPELEPFVDKQPTYTQPDLKFVIRKTHLESLSK
jgi:hypothetical protein